MELPRDDGKTTRVCPRVLWEPGRDPNLRVKIVCASEPFGRAKIGQQAVQISAVANDPQKMNATEG